MQDFNENALHSLLERRKFLKKTGLGGLGIAGASLLGSRALAVPAAAQVPGPGTPVPLSANDVAILNFALTWNIWRRNSIPWQLPATPSRKKVSV